MKFQDIHLVLIVLWLTSKIIYKHQSYNNFTRSYWYLIWTIRLSEGTKTPTSFRNNLYSVLLKSLVEKNSFLFFLILDCQFPTTPHNTNLDSQLKIFTNFNDKDDSNKYCDFVYFMISFSLRIEKQETHGILLEVGDECRLKQILWFGVL